MYIMSNIVFKGTFTPEPQYSIVDGNLTSVWVYEMKSNYKFIFGLDEKKAPLETGVVNHMTPLFTRELNKEIYSFEISDELYNKFIQSFKDKNYAINMNAGDGKTLEGIFFKDTSPIKDASHITDASKKGGKRSKKKRGTRRRITKRRRL